MFSRTLLAALFLTLLCGCTQPPEGYEIYTNDLYVWYECPKCPKCKKRGPPRYQRHIVIDDAWSHERTVHDYKRKVN